MICCLDSSPCQEPLRSIASTLPALAELYWRPRDPPARVAAFVLDCYDRCRELEKNDD